MRARGENANHLAADATPRCRCLAHQPCALGPVLARSPLGAPARLHWLRTELTALGVEIATLTIAVRRTQQALAAGH